MDDLTWLQGQEWNLLRADPGQEEGLGGGCGERPGLLGQELSSSFSFPLTALS